MVVVCGSGDIQHMAFTLKLKVAYSLFRLQTPRASCVFSPPLIFLSCPVSGSLPTSLKIRSHSTPASFFSCKTRRFDLETQVFFKQSTTTDHQNVARYLYTVCNSENVQPPNYYNGSGKVPTFLPASDKSISSRMDNTFYMH